MKVFVIKKGTEVILSKENGETKTVICKKDTDFVLEDIVTDPVKCYNQNMNQIINYSIFRLKKGYHTNSDFDYAIVKYRDVQVLC